MHRFNDHRRICEKLDFAGYRPEVVFNLVRLGFARRSQLIVDGLLERIARAYIAQSAGNQDGDRAQQKQNSKEFG